MEVQILQKNTGKFEKGQKPWNSGIHYSEELKKKMNFSGLDKGRAWNKGKKYPEFSGKNHWNWKGSTICECGAKKSIPAKNCQTCANIKISKRMLGNKHGLGTKHTLENRRKMSEYRVAHPIQVFKDTKIEVIIENLLQKYRIDYLKQAPLCKVTVSDFYLEDSKIAIFCDGCYWHGCKIHRSIDKAVKLNQNQNRVLMENGISVIRLWEHDIKNNPEDCISRIINLVTYKQSVR